MREEADARHTLVAGELDLLKAEQPDTEERKTMVVDLSEFDH